MCDGCDGDDEDDDEGVGGVAHEVGNRLFMAIKMAVRHNDVGHVQCAG